jgi:hypothetical protein
MQSELTSVAREIIRNHPVARAFRVDLDEQLIEQDEHGTWWVPVFANGLDEQLAPIAELLDMSDELVEAIEERTELRVRLEWIEPRGF